MLVGLLLSALLMSCTSVKNQDENKLPLWYSYETLEDVFPNKDFIARIGRGDSLQAARMDGDFEIASFFRQSVRASIVSREEYFTREGSTSESNYLSKNMDFSTDLVLVGLRHTDFFYDKNRGEYSVCSYINRNDAWKILEPDITASLSDFKRYDFLSKNEKDLFKKISLQNRAIKESEKFYDLYFMALALVPHKASSYSAVEKLIRELKAENFIQKNKCLIKIESVDSSSNLIKTKVEEVFRREGFVVTEKQPVYHVWCEAFFEAMVKGSVYRSEPALRIKVEKIEDGTCMLYVKKIESVSSYTKEAAESLALNRMESEIEKNLMNELLNGGER